MSGVSPNGEILMKKYHSCFTKRSFIATALMVMALPAFASTNPPYTLKTQSSRAASVESIHARPSEGKVLVSGLLRISPAYSDSTAGYLCVTVISKNGKVLSYTPVNYNKNLHGRNLSQAQWKVSYVTSVNAPADSTIIVSHHNGSTSSCRASHEKT